MAKTGSSGGGEAEGFTGRAAIGYDAEIFYLDPTYIQGFVEGCLERIGEERRRR